MSLINNINIYDLNYTLYKRVNIDVLLQQYTHIITEVRGCRILIRLSIQYSSKRTPCWKIIPNDYRGILIKNLILLIYT